MGPEEKPEAQAQTVLAVRDRAAIASWAIWIGAAMACVGLLAVLFVILGKASPKPPPARNIPAELRALETRLEGPLKLEQFGAAITILKESRKASGAAEWTAAVDRRIGEIEGHAKRLYREIRDQAVEAKTLGAQADVAALTARLSQWGMPSKVADLEVELAGVTLAPPIPPGGLRLVPNHVPDGRVRNRIGIPKGVAVEGIGLGSIRAVGFEGDLFAVPSEGEIQVTCVTDAKQPMILRLRITDENNQSTPYDFALKDALPGQPVQSRASFRDFKAIGGRTLPAGGVIRALFVTGQDKNVSFQVTELVVVKRKD